jgi:hypothetical protein
MNINDCSEKAGRVRFVWKFLLLIALSILKLYLFLFEFSSPAWILYVFLFIFALFHSFPLAIIVLLHSWVVPSVYPSTFFLNFSLRLLHLYNSRIPLFPQNTIVSSCTWFVNKLFPQTPIKDINTKKTLYLLQVLYFLHPWLCFFSLSRQKIHLSA